MHGPPGTGWQSQKYAPLTSRLAIAAGHDIWRGIRSALARAADEGLAVPCGPPRLALPPPCTRACPRPSTRAVGEAQSADRCSANFAEAACQCNRPRVNPRPPRPAPSSPTVRGLADPACGAPNRRRSQDRSAGSCLHCRAAVGEGAEGAVSIEGHGRASRKRAAKAESALQHVARGQASEVRGASKGLLDNTPGRRRRLEAARGFRWGARARPPIL